MLNSFSLIFPPKSPWIYLRIFADSFTNPSHKREISQYNGLYPAPLCQESMDYMHVIHQLYKCLYSRPIYSDISIKIHHSLEYIWGEKMQRKQNKIKKTQNPKYPKNKDNAFSKKNKIYQRPLVWPFNSVPCHHPWFPLSFELIHTISLIWERAQQTCVRFDSILLEG